MSNEKLNLPSNRSWLLDRLLLYKMVYFHNVCSNNMDLRSCVWNVFVPHSNLHQRLLNGLVIDEQRFYTDCSHSPTQFPQHNAHFHRVCFNRSFSPFLLNCVPAVWSNSIFSVRLTVHLVRRWLPWQTLKKARDLCVQHLWQNCNYILCKYIQPKKKREDPRKDRLNQDKHKHTPVCANHELYKAIATDGHYFHNVCLPLSHRVPWTGVNKWIAVSTDAFLARPLCQWCHCPACPRPFLWRFYSFKPVHLMSPVTTAQLPSLSFHAAPAHRDEWSVSGRMIDTGGAGGCDTVWCTGVGGVCGATRW